MPLQRDPCKLFSLANKITFRKTLRHHPTHNRSVLRSLVSPADDKSIEQDLLNNHTIKRLSIITSRPINAPPPGRYEQSTRSCKPSPSGSRSRWVLVLCLVLPLPCYPSYYLCVLRWAQCPVLVCPSAPKTEGMKLKIKTPRSMDCLLIERTIDLQVTPTSNMIIIINTFNPRSVLS